MYGMYAHIHTGRQAHIIKPHLRWQVPRLVIFWLGMCGVLCVIEVDKGAVFAREWPTMAQQCSA